MASQLMQQLTETAEHIRSIYPHTITTGIILGSGLGNLSSEMEIEQEIAYETIPHFPVSTVEGHQGKMILADWVVKECW